MTIVAIKKTLGTKKVEYTTHSKAEYDRIEKVNLDKNIMITFWESRLPTQKTITHMIENFHECYNTTSAIIHHVEKHGKKLLVI